MNADFDVELSSDPSLRRVWRLRAGLGFRSIVMLALLGGVLIGCSRQPAFRGTAVDPPRQPFDFTLRDQFGQRVRLSDLKGRVVVLTFLYSHCPDVCPLITSNLRRTSELLDSRAPGVAFLAVTVDPGRDTVGRLYQYSRQYGMLHRWHFLTGDPKDLRPIWDYYWVGEVTTELAGSAAYETRLERAQKNRSGEDTERLPPGPYAVQHTAPTQLIDQEGMIRVAYGSTFRPAELAEDVQTLLDR